MYPPARASSLPPSAYPLRHLPFTQPLPAIVAPLLTGISCLLSPFVCLLAVNAPQHVTRVTLSVR
ncbi:hypothetical protein OH76DRAFT_1412869 [Lentinus brumalis]|uniref:Uncharacterized protein n=1 Tax=Lentinus brumalis TaxID=2498619 RepID=A0A371CJW9_9APHY|nr:hypothetical protein OH76DRAFT_1412869 [Polyporus brumalis]